MAISTQQSLQRTRVQPASALANFSLLNTTIGFALGMSLATICYTNFSSAAIPVGFLTFWIGAILITQPWFSAIGKLGAVLMVAGFTAMVGFIPLICYVP